MRTYRSRPKPRRARAVWDYITKKKGREPTALWKNPNCWGRMSVVGNAWGWWYAEYPDGNEPIHPHDLVE